MGVSPMSSTSVPLVGLTAVPAVFLAAGLRPAAAAGWSPGCPLERARRPLDSRPRRPCYTRARCPCYENAVPSEKGCMTVLSPPWGSSQVAVIFVVAVQPNGLASSSPGQAQRRPGWARPHVQAPPGRDRCSPADDSPRRGASPQRFRPSRAHNTNCPPPRPLAWARGFQPLGLNGNNSGPAHPFRNLATLTPRRPIFPGLIWHSHRTNVFQPSLRRVRRFLTSLAALRASLATQ